MVEEKKEEAKPDELATMKSELANLAERLNKQDAAIGRKERENQKLREMLQTRDDTSDLSKAAFAVLAQKTGNSIDEVETLVRSNQPDLASQFETILEKSKKQRQQDEQTRVANDLQKRITSLGFGAGMPEYFEVFGRVAMNDSDGAYARIEALEAKKAEKKETPVVNPPIDIEAIREEERRKVLEEQGRLVAETGIPAGKAQGKPIHSLQSIAQMSVKEYQATFPNGQSDVLQAINEGRVTE